MKAIRTMRALCNECGGRGCVECQKTGRVVEALEYRREVKVRQTMPVEQLRTELGWARRPSDWF